MNKGQAASTIRDIGRADVRLAEEVLAKAFCGYPFFEYCLGAENYEHSAPKMFASFVRWTMLYGKAWATSDLEAVALRRPPGTRSIGFWDALRSGLAFTFLPMDGATRRRFARSAPIVEETHQRIMGDQPHWHCWMMGVTPGPPRFPPQLRTRNQIGLGQPDRQSLSPYSLSFYFCQHR